ncbi:hypothetical protein SUGI_0276020 [Cryptomeria japonica]|nr:hypothetical protein SUGI_0276020 [Cryptomeria japonica]
MPYKQMVDGLKQHFTKIDFEQIPREQNRAADAMATIASLIDLPPNKTRYEFLVDNLLVPSYEIMPTEMICVVGPESQLYGSIFTYLRDNTLPPDLSNNQRRTFIHQSSRYVILADILYRRGLDGTLLRCLESDKAQVALREVHEGICGPHASGPTLAKKLIRTGYYWPNMEKDSYQFVKKCKIHPPSSNGHKFIITTIEYFTKWIEAVPLTQVTGKQIATFILNYIICRYGIPISIIADNGRPFKNQDVHELCDRFHISHHFSTPYYPQGNGQAEASNKRILKILKKTVDDAGHNWHIQLNPALWAYRTSVRTPTGATPYSLVCGSKAILPIEVELPSLQVSLQNIISDEDYRVSRLQELELLDERRQTAYSHLKAYQQRMSHSYNHKVKPRTFEVGDLVLRENPKNQQDREKKGKFEPNWLGPYIIIVAYRSGAYQLSTIEGEPLEDPINSMHLRRFYT